MPLANKLELLSPPLPIKIMKNFLREHIDRCRLKTNMDEINWCNDFYLDMLSLDFDGLFLTVDLKSSSYFVIGTINR